MVRRAERWRSAWRLVAALALLASAMYARAEAPPSPDSQVFFRMEFSKSEIYPGEQVIANFMLYAKEDVLDVEVAKFPEFRGYWSENLSLRQGPIPLMGGFDNTGLKRTLVGSYILTSMIGKEDPSIVPMKLVVRHALADHAADFPERALLSEPTPLTIHPLPPLPAKADPRHFKGAVGRFSLAPETTTLAFQKDEPVTVRYLLQGEGNFQEVNAIDLPLPPQVELLTKRAFTQGAGQYSSKTFEITLNVHSDQNFTLPEIPFIFFNPAFKRYEQITLPTLKFVYQPPPPPDKDAGAEPLEMPPPELRWSAYHPLGQCPLFYVLQGLLALLCLGIFYLRWSREAALRRQQTPEFRHKLKVQACLARYRAGELEGFLRQADELALEILHSQVRPFEPMSKQQMLRALERGGQGEKASHARALFAAYDSLYTPMKTPPSDPRGLLEALAKLLGQRLDEHAA